MRAFVRAFVRACVRACVRARVHATLSPKVINVLRPKQKNVVFQVTGPKKLGRVGREIFFFIIFFLTLQAYNTTSFMYTICYTKIKTKRLHQWQ